MLAKKITIVIWNIKSDAKKKSSLLKKKLSAICFQRFNAYKYHWSDSRVPVILEVNPGSLDQVDPASNRLLCGYDYKDMEGFVQVTVSDYSSSRFFFPWSEVANEDLK